MEEQNNTENGSSLEESSPTKEDNHSERIETPGSVIHSRINPAISVLGKLASDDDQLTAAANVSENHLVSFLLSAISKSSSLYL